MRCIFCDGYVPLAEPRGSDVYCTGCGAKFAEVHDYGFFDYTVEMYQPKPKPDVKTDD